MCSKQGPLKCHAFIVGVRHLETANVRIECLIVPSQRTSHFQRCLGALLGLPGSEIVMFDAKQHLSALANTHRPPLTCIIDNLFALVL